MAKKHDGLGGRARRRPRVAAYIRVSAVMGQGDDLFSPEIQEKAIRSLCEREGLNIVSVEADPDVTGRESKRHRIGPLIERVRSGEIDGIAVRNFARWAAALANPFSTSRPCDRRADGAPLGMGCPVSPPGRRRLPAACWTRPLLARPPAHRHVDSACLRPAGGRLAAGDRLGVDLHARRQVPLECRDHGPRSRSRQGLVIA